MLSANNADLGDPLTTEIAFLGSKIIICQMSDSLKCPKRPKVQLRGRLVELEEAYLLWYEFLWLARFSEDPKILAVLKKREKFYEPWGDEYFFPEEWWESHSELFEEIHVVRRLDPDQDKSRAPNAIIVEIPLTQSPTKLSRDVKEIISAAWAERASTRTKQKKNSTARYRMTAGSEVKRGKLADILNVYISTLDKGKLRGERLLKVIHASFETRAARKVAKIPSTLLYNPDDIADTERALKAAKRYIKKAEKIMLNVANGEFPGDYQPIPSGK
ncbi:hypothetical protein [Methylocystis sp. SB2]|uniref:hypothetical protein n=1 Tax=Methylocystis sp. (strain SB2) TaxID=743836 RepID=UPI00056C696B|nr:hypothetical protein [Methylocystis sp. SB2]ULO25092.1 hypothetical protein LNB28_06810 [Methylocystis sp. SB2]